MRSSAGGVGDSGELARLVPGLRERLPELPVPVRDDPEGQRGRFFAAVARYLGVRATECPLLVAFEDVHWADQPTLDLLRYLNREMERVPVLIALSFRDHEVEDPLAAVLASFARAGYERLCLAGLGSTEVERLARQHLEPGPVPAELVEALQHHTDGNAFFLAEVLRDLNARANGA